MKVDVFEIWSPNGRMIELAPPYHGYGYRPGQRYYALNLLCELDSPGEWYLDRTAGILYLLPPRPADSARAVLSVLPSLFVLKDCSWVTLRGFTLEAVRGTAVAVSGGRGAVVAGSTVRNTGSWAVTRQWTSMTCS